MKLVSMSVRQKERESYRKLFNALDKLYNNILSESNLLKRVTSVSHKVIRLV